MVAWLPILLFNSTKIGANALQGPHHSAEKSTNTGFSELIISENLAIIVFCFTCFNPYQSIEWAKTNQTC
jgi:hypothetical protein